jgi:cell division septation protein DedD
MASRGNRGGAGDRVLESRHVIGLFLLMLVFSGVFFALGYVMGRNQYDGQVRAASTSRPTPDYVVPAKSEPPPKRSKNSAVTPTPAASDENEPPSSDWGFYNAGKVAPDDRLKPASTSMWPTPGPSSSSPAAPTRSPSHLSDPSTSSKPVAATSASVGTYTLQVAALRKEADAHAVASSLQKKKFLAFVVAPTTDNYYHVQVGPYPDLKSAEAAKKGLESAGFKAIVKH